MRFAGTSRRSGGTAIQKAADGWTMRSSDSDLRVPPCNHFEKLRANLAGWYSVRVSNQWR